MYKIQFISIQMRLMIAFFVQSIASLYCYVMVFLLCMVHIGLVSLRLFA